MVRTRREDTSETLLNGRGPDVIRERKRNKMEASWIGPTTFIQSFLLERVLRLRWKRMHPVTCGRRTAKIGVAFRLTTARTIAILSLSSIVRNRAAKVRLLPE